MIYPPIYPGIRELQSWQQGKHVRAVAETSGRPRIMITCRAKNWRLMLVSVSDVIWIEKLRKAVELSVNSAPLRLIITRLSLEDVGGCVLCYRNLPRPRGKGPIIPKIAAMPTFGDHKPGDFFFWTNTAPPPQPPPPNLPNLTPPEISNFASIPPSTRVSHVQVM